MIPVILILTYILIPVMGRINRKRHNQTFNLDTIWGREAQSCAANACSFDKVCRDFKINQIDINVTLAATCNNSNIDPQLYGYTESTLDLGSCVWNDNGNLEWGPDGGAFESCYDCSLNETRLHCTCNVNAAEKRESTIDLAQNIKTQNGVLVCDRNLGIVNGFGGVDQVCTELSLADEVPSILVGTCRNGLGNYSVKSFLDLNDCVVYDRLARTFEPRLWGNAFDDNCSHTVNSSCESYCKDITLNSEAFLHASCPDQNSQYWAVGIYIRSFVGVQNGTLGCFGQVGHQVNL